MRITSLRAYMSIPGVIPVPFLVYTLRRAQRYTVLKSERWHPQQGYRSWERACLCLLWYCFGLQFNSTGIYYRKENHRSSSTVAGSFGWVSLAVCPPELAPNPICFSEIKLTMCTNHLRCVRFELALLCRPREV